MRAKATQKKIVAKLYDVEKPFKPHVKPFIRLTSVDIMPKCENTIIINSAFFFSRRVCLFLFQASVDFS